MTDRKFGKCQCCGTETQLFNAPSRFGEETWACDECWNPDGEVSPPRHDQAQEAAIELARKEREK